VRQVCIKCGQSFTQNKWGNRKFCSNRCKGLMNYHRNSSKINHRRKVEYDSAREQELMIRRIKRGKL